MTLTSLLFEMPWWLFAGLCFGGVVLFVSGNARLESRMKYGGVGLIALALAWAAMSYFVDTDREKCEKKTRQFVEAIAKQDWAGMKALLDPQVRFLSWHGRDVLAKEIELQVSSHGLKSASISSVVGRPDTSGELIGVSFQVASEHDMGTLITRWRFDWAPSGNDRLVKGISFLGSPIPAVNNAVENVGTRGGE